MKKVLVNTFNEIMSSNIDLWIIAHSKDLFTTLSSCRLASDRFIRGVVSCILFEFSTKVVSKMIWIPGNSNLTDCRTKSDSPLTNSMHLMPFQKSRSIDL